MSSSAMSSAASPSPSPSPPNIDAASPCASLREEAGRGGETLLRPLAPLSNIDSVVSLLPLDEGGGLAPNMLVPADAAGTGAGASNVLLLLGGALAAALGEGSPPPNMLAPAAAAGTGAGASNVLGGASAVASSVAALGGESPPPNMLDPAAATGTGAGASNVLGGASAIVALGGESPPPNMLAPAAAGALGGASTAIGGGSPPPNMLDPADATGTGAGASNVSSYLPKLRFFPAVGVSASAAVLCVEVAFNAAVVGDGAPAAPGGALANILSLDAAAADGDTAAVVIGGGAEAEAEEGEVDAAAVDASTWPPNILAADAVGEITGPPPTTTAAAAAGLGPEGGASKRLAAGFAAVGSAAAAATAAPAPAPAPAVPCIGGGAADENIFPRPS